MYRRSLEFEPQRHRAGVLAVGVLVEVELGKISRREWPSGDRVAFEPVAGGSRTISIPLSAQIAAGASLHNGTLGVLVSRASLFEEGNHVQQVEDDSVGRAHGVVEWAEGDGAAVERQRLVRQAATAGLEARNEHRL